MNDHARTLKTMIHQRDDGSPCICAECRAVQAAIAALEAGRSGEAGKVPTGPYVERIIRIFRDKPHDDTTALVLIDYANARIAAAPQQPTPGGVTDAMESAYGQGWYECSDWAGRNDLKADVDSPAYVRQRTKRLSFLSHQQPAPSVSEAYCSRCDNNRQVLANEADENDETLIPCPDCRPPVPMGVTDANRLLDAYDDAVQELYSDQETGWDAGGCRAAYMRRIRRLRAIILRRLSHQQLPPPPNRDNNV